MLSFKRRGPQEKLTKLLSKKGGAPPQTFEAGMEEGVNRKEINKRMKEYTYRVRMHGLSANLIPLILNYRIWPAALGNKIGRRDLKFRSKKMGEFYHEVLSKKPTLKEIKEILIKNGIARNSLEANVQLKELLKRGGVGSHKPPFKWGGGDEYIRYQLKPLGKTTSGETKFAIKKEVIRAPEWMTKGVDWAKAGQKYRKKKIYAENKESLPFPFRW